MKSYSLRELSLSYTLSVASVCVIFSMLPLALLAAPSGAIGSSTIPGIIPVRTNPWFVQSFVAVSVDTDFHDSVIGADYEQSREYNSLSGVSVGKKISDKFIVWPFDIFAYASVQHFNERGFQADGWGATAYVKAYHTFMLPYTRMPIRLGFGNGLSYVSKIPVSEAREFAPYQSRKLIYYMDYSLQISVNYLLGVPDGKFSPGVEDVYLGYSIWHRSSAFGLFADSTDGINYLGLSLELSLR